MGGLLVDYSGFYDNLFGTSNIDAFDGVPRIAQNVVINFIGAAENITEFNQSGQSYILDCDDKIIYPGTIANPYVDMSDILPNGEYTFICNFKGYKVAFRGKLQYFYYSPQYRFGFSIYYFRSKEQSEIDTFMNTPYNELRGVYSNGFYERYVYSDSSNPFIKLKKIDFSQVFMNESTNQTWGVSGVGTCPFITFEKDDDGVERYVPQDNRFYYCFESSNFLWENVPGPEPYIYDRKGKFPGMPTSTIPLRQTIPSGIDYRHYITVYDETNYNARNMFLTNKVGDIPYTLIDYTVPRGRLRVATDLQFTHFVCCSFTSDNLPRIYRVTSYHVLGDNLIEYDFEMDGLKDYFQHQGITTDNNFLVGRCTISSKWNKLLKDTAFYDGTFTDYVVTGSTVYNYYAMNCPGGIYVLNETAFREFCTWLTVDAAQYSAAIVGQISSVYIVPYTENNNIYASHPNTLTFSLAAEPFAMTFETTGTIYRYNVSLNVGRYNDYVECSLGSCSEIIETFREMFDSNATIHVPFYGDFTPSLDILSRLATGSVNIRYYVSPVDGNLSISFYPYVEVLPVVGLPSRTLPVNSSVSAMYSINRDQALSNTMNTATGVVGIGKGVISNLATGNVGGAVASVLGGAVDMKLNEYNINKSADNSRQTISERQGVTTVTGTGGGAIMCREVYISFQVPNLSIGFDDLFSSIGYPVQKLWTSIGATSGGRYYVQMLGKVKGAQWYSDLVMGDIQSDYIVYNY